MSAELNVTFLQKGKKLRNIKQLSHSGADKLYFNFLDTIEDQTFLSKVKDLDGISRRNDSELKFIYNFLTNHMTEGDEIVIEMFNIFRPCYSCKRELLMFQETLEQTGKKVKFIMHYDDSIIGTVDLLKKLNQ